MLYNNDIQGFPLFEHNEQQQRGNTLVQEWSKVQQTAWVILVQEWLKAQRHHITLAQQ
jgi:hypothetical protein